MVTAIDWQVLREVGVMGTARLLKESGSTVNLSSYGANMQVLPSRFTLQRIRPVEWNRTNTAFAQGQSLRYLKRVQK